jgi:hypothetical protein
MSDEKKISDLTIEDKDSKCEAVINRENFEKSLQNMWGYSDVGLEAKKAAMTMLSTKTGMYARIPLVCKAEGCPYAETCSLLQYSLAPLGEPCPIETAQIELRYAGYEKDFNLDDSNTTFTDKNLVLTLINDDIMLERCKALLNKEGVLVEDVFAGVSEQGDVYTKPEITKHWEAYERVRKKRDEVYDLMMATRKNRKGDKEEKDSLSSYIMDVMSGNTEFVEDAIPEEFVEVEENNNDNNK